MTIGIDLTSLQGAHRMRGIGYTLLNLINHMSDADKRAHEFVFYFLPVDGSRPDPLPLLNLEGINYEVRHIGSKKRVQRRLRGKLGIITGLVNQLLELKDLHFGDTRLGSLKGIDYFLQTDPSQCLPKRHRGTRFGLVLYDIIPFVLEWDYLWSYRVARIRGHSRKGALRKHVHRWLYAHRLKENARRADQLLAISKHTKNDFVRYFNIDEAKITVTPLGVSEVRPGPEITDIVVYKPTSWGYLPFMETFDKNTPYILFVGGADSRRKLDDLVAAFNVLRASGKKIKLVLAGDSMQGPKNIATDNIRDALQESSYLEDIVFTGFTDDTTREWLYAHCLCFVFPSRYEGFGLPVLEAMIHGSPVISYDNAAVREIAKDVPIYTTGVRGLAEEIGRLLALDDRGLDKIRQANITHAKRYDWRKTSKQVFSVIRAK